MLRLPRFTLVEPRTVADAVQARADAGPDAMYVAGGTDLWPNMKRRQQTPRTVIALSRIPELARVSGSPRDGLTIGGNLLLDTRCNYYDQTEEWRRAIDYCMKKDGAICWVATSSPRCWAVQSSDGVPVAVALGAEVTLASARGERRIRAADLYANDGIAYLTKRPDELLTAYHLPPVNGWRASYVKLRRRGSFDFPVLGVAAFVRRAAGGEVKEARIVLGAVASHPQDVPEAAAALIGAPLSDAAITAAADAAYKPAKPMDNTDFTLAWRKEMVRVHVKRALAQLAGS